MKPVTASEIINALVTDRWLQAFVLPNYAPLGWWENDVFEITKAGFWHEFEVKVSRPDFLADARKRKYGRWEDAKNGYGNKHELLATRSTKGPARFTFVTPVGLIPLADIPEWAGLIEAERVVGKYSPQGRVTLTVKKVAPRLHGEKLGEARRRKAEQTAYYRFHRATVRHGVEEFSDREGI